MLNNRFSQLLAGAIVGGGVFLLLDALFLEQYFFSVKEQDIGEPLDTEKKIKFVLVTDIHLGKKILPQQKRLARRINRINPDLLLIGGDAIDEHGKRETLDRFLKLIHHRIPKVAIMGNHDYKAESNPERINEIYQKHNGDLLVNETKAYTIGNKRFVITGVDDFIEGKENFLKAIKEIKGEKNHIVLIHSPLQQERILEEIEKINIHREEEDQLNISYIFAGHNHGGQVTLGTIVPILPEKAGKYLYGWYNQQRPYLFVSRGMGTSQIPFRFGARSEVLLFNYYV